MIETSEPFEDTGRPAQQLSLDFVLDLEGYEGPIDALLQLAREQKVDLAKISILALADQYLSFIGHARRLRRLRRYLPLHRFEATDCRGGQIEIVHRRRRL